MKRRTMVMLQIAALAAMLGAAGCPTGGGNSTNPALSVIPAAFNFGVNKDEDSFAIQNVGAGILVWSVNESIDWLTVTPSNGSTPVGGPSIAKLTVDRTGLAPGTYTEEFSIASNGGTRTISVTIKVSAAPLPPTLAVNPVSLDFGTTDTLIELDVENDGTGTVNWNLTENIPWLMTSVTSGATSTTPTTVVVTVDRTGLAPGTHTDSISFTSDGGDINVPVTLNVPGPTPLLAVNPTAINFGTNTTDLQFTIRNSGTSTLNWNISESLPWLSLDITSGSTTTETETITAHVTRTGLSPNDYAGVIAVTSDGGSANIQAAMTVAPAQLIVVPTTLNFGKYATDKLLTISNGGTGTVNWSISNSGFPAWLSLTPPLSGDVTSETDGVIVSVNRATLTPGQYSHTFTVTSDAGNVNVTVNVSVAEVPVLTIDTGFLNSNNNPLAPLGDEATTFDFTITNSGTGTLNWNINPDTFPDWLNMSPVAGEVQGAPASNTVRITISRIGLGAGGYSAQIPVTSNGGNKTLEITMQVPLRPVIGVLPDNLDFGLSASTGTAYVANIGDPGTVLNYLAVSDRSWLFISPDTGTSIGTDAIVKDYQEMNVSIDRSQLESTGGTGTITVYAVDGAGEIDPNIEPETITVSVEAADLAFQTSLVNTRIPSMMRFAMIMRDIHDDSFIMDPLLLTDAFHIFEDGIALEEPSETTQQVYLQNSALTAPISDERIDLRIRTVLLLDYSGSMQVAAVAAGFTDIQALYEAVVPQFIDDYFLNFANVERGFATMEIMEFNDRYTTATVIQGFSSDATVLKNALMNINISDNGASAILPAVKTASDSLVNADFPYIGFDNTDIRAIALFSDGRLTTPPGTIQDYIDSLVTRRVRVMPVGWGVGVNHEPLARLASSTGGHYYLTKPDASNNPTVANFESRVADLDRDLASHTVMSYVTLNEEESVPIRFDGVLNRPDDDPDRGLIQGTLPEQNINMAALVGDILMGQISMRTTGIQGGATQVTLRADYIPRNIDKFQFTVTSAQAFNPPVIVPHDEGGLVEGWVLTHVSGGTYSLTSPADVLPYGSYGDLVRLTFPAVGVPSFAVSLDVDNTIYSTDIEPKYFIYPDSIDVGADPYLAPAFPTPSITPSLIDLGTATNSFTLNVRNIGGTYPYGGGSTVHLHWLVDEIPVFVSDVSPEEGLRSTTIGSDGAVVTVNRTLAQGAYTGTIVITWDDNTLNVGGRWPVVVSMTILPPILTPTGTGALAFGNVSQAAGTVTHTFNVTNTGQSTLSWAIVTAGLPAWIQSVIPSSGTTINGEIDPVNVTVDPSAVAPGSYNTSLLVLSNGGNQNVPVSITVTP